MSDTETDVKAPLTLVELIQAARRTESGSPEHGRVWERHNYIDDVMAGSATGTERSYFYALVSVALNAPTHVYNVVWGEIEDIVNAYV